MCDKWILELLKACPKTESLTLKYESPERDPFRETYFHALRRLTIQNSSLMPQHFTHFLKEYASPLEVITITDGHLPREDLTFKPLPKDDDYVNGHGRSAVFKIMRTMPCLESVHISNLRQYGDSCESVTCKIDDVTLHSLDATTSMIFPEDAACKLADELSLDLTVTCKPRYDTLWFLRTG